MDLNSNDKSVVYGIFTDWANDLKHMLSHPLIVKDFKIRQEIVERIELASKLSSSSLGAGSIKKAIDWIEENLHSPELNIQNQAKKLKKIFLDSGQID